MKSEILVFADDSPRAILSIVNDSLVGPIAFIRGRTRLAFAIDGAIHIWDIHDRREIAALKGHDSGISAIIISPDGSRIVTGAADGTVRVWDGNHYELLLTFRIPSDKGAVSALAVSSDGMSIAAGMSDGTIYIWYSNPPNER
jgi:WD40 repeat protein